MTETRTVLLRTERSDQHRRHVLAYLDSDGNLHVDVQDFGPDTAPVSPDEVHEWFGTIRSIDVPRLVELLEGELGRAPLDILQATWSGSRSHELERLLRDSGIDAVAIETLTVLLRGEQSAQDTRSLWAYLDSDGNLHVDGQDFGPGTAPVSPDGEYEWFKTIRAVDVPRLVELLGGEAGSDPLDILQARYRGSRSYELEQTLRDSGIDIHLHVYP